MEVFQCPICELRYHNTSELDEHIAIEHPDFVWKPKTLEDSLLGAAHRRHRRTPKYPPDYKADPPDDRETARANSREGGEQR